MAKHNKEHDCWVVLYGCVYNLTGFLKEHPGGKESILLYGGSDATEQFEMMHQKEFLNQLHPSTKLGRLKK